MQKCEKCKRKVKKTYKKRYYTSEYCWDCHKKLPLYPPGVKRQKINELHELESRWNNKASLSRWNQGHGYRF